MGAVLKNTSKNIRRSPYQSLAAVFLLIVTLFVAQVFALLAFGFHEILGYFETRPQVTAFFKDEATSEEIMAVKQELEQQAFVGEVTYVSKEEALRIYQEQNQDDPLLLEMVSADILPASLEVSATAIDSLPQINNRLSALPNVEEVVFQQDVIDSLKNWSRAIQLVGLVVVSLLVFTSVLVLIVLISLKVAAKRIEIATMRLLGASSWFIRGPFILEGATYGILGALFSWLLLLGLVTYAKPYLVGFLADIAVMSLELPALGILGGATAIIGSFLGMFAAFVAVKRFYK